MGVEEIRQYERYLGLPSLVGKNKKASFNYIKEIVWRKIQWWKEKLLSQAGREILIKAVIQAIPSYTMNCFKLPLGLCAEIERLIRKFWWVRKETGGRFIGSNGKLFASQNLKGVWDSKTWPYSMMHYLQNKHGGFCTIRIPYFIGYSNPNSFRIARFWRPQILIQDLMLGKVS